MACFTINRCCCLSLYTAGIVIGVLGALAALFPLVFSIHEVAFANDYVEPDDDGYHHKRSKTSTKFVLVASFAYLVTSILLIVGTIKNSHRMLLPWLLINVVVILPCFQIVATYYCIIILSLGGARAKDIFQMTAFFAVFFGIAFWILIAVYSLFKSIRDKNNQGIVIQENQTKLIDGPPHSQIVQYTV